MENKISCLCHDCEKDVEKRSPSNYPCRRVKKIKGDEEIMDLMNVMENDPKPNFLRYTLLAMEMMYEHRLGTTYHLIFLKRIRVEMEREYNLDPWENSK